MLTFEQIKELTELVARLRLEGLEVERSGFRLKIAGAASAQAAPATAAPATPEAPAVPGGARQAPGVTGGDAVTAVAGPAAASPPPPPAAGTHVLTSPIVGTFYASSSPDSDPYVRAGDRVRKGQVLCIIEAMKLMNEIESDVDGVIVEIYPKNAQPVEFGEPLYALRPE